MKKLYYILKDKNTQYIVVIWVLLLKAIEILLDVLSEFEPLYFLKVLRFRYPSTLSCMVWDCLVIFAVVWLIYRLLKDIFEVHVTLRPFSRKEAFNLAILLIWTTLATFTILQFAILATDSFANPVLKVSRYYAPIDVKARNSSVLVIDSLDKNKVTLDLSKSIFAYPFSINSSGKCLCYGTTVGSSYFTIRNSSLGQRMIEIRFCGNGTDKINGWFAYRVELMNPLPISENLTLSLLLKLTPSVDGTAWTWYKIDFLTNENNTYSLVFKFVDVHANYIWKNEMGTINYYLIGSVTDWKFYQFNLNDLFYSSFSQKPSYISGVEYAIGAESDNDIKAYFLLAKLSPSPFKINSKEVRNVRHDTLLRHNRTIIIKGITLKKLFVIFNVIPEKVSINYGFTLFGMSRTEFYRWNLERIPDEVLHSVVIIFNVSSRAKALFLNGNDITSQVHQPMHSQKLNETSKQVTLIVIEEINNNFTNILLILFPIIALAINFILFRRRNFRN